MTKTAKILLTLLLVLTAFSAQAKKVREQTVKFGTMKATYNGNGTLSVIPSMGTDIWDITITDAGVWYLDGELKVAPQEKYKKVPADVKIRQIYSDGVLMTLDVTFPPGLTHTPFVQNVYINGNIRYLRIKGGDLGSPLGAGGQLRICGRCTNFSLSGKVYDNPITQVTEYWGGNLWADFRIDDQIQYTKIVGGNLYFDPATGGTHGKIDSTEHMRTFQVSSKIVKDKITKEPVCYGGVVNADITSYTHGLKEFSIKGGVLFGSFIRSKFMRTFNVTGYKSATKYPISPEYNGIRNSYFEVRDYNKTTLEYTNFYIRGISVKEGDIRDSIFTCQGNLRDIRAKATTLISLGTVSNTLVRGGFAGPSIDYDMPSLTMRRTAFFSTNAILEIPFAISNMAPDSVYAVYLPHRALAWGSTLEIGSSMAEGLGKIYLTGIAETNGIFKWDVGAERIFTGNNTEFSITNLVIRVMKYGTPELCLDIRPRLVLQANSKAEQTLHYPTTFEYEPHTETSKATKGDVTAFSCNQSYNSIVAGGCLVTDLKYPEHASYLGSVKSYKLKYGGTGNYIISKGQPAISKKAFDFFNNQVWVSGERWYGE